MFEKISNSSFITQNGLDFHVVPTQLSLADQLGSWKARWAIGRMKYVVEQGVYVVGNPDSNSVVLVSANYKMSLDRLRSELTDLDAWILVIDTKGINVWCAAGKGTFGTDEIVQRIETVKLAEVVDHRRLVLPQLGAPGVSAHEVKRRSGFSVTYGPVRAEDLPAFLSAGMKATKEMHRVRFPLSARAVLIPVELVMGTKHIMLFAACFLLLAGLGRRGYSGSLVLSEGLAGVILIFAAYLAAIIGGPVLLPWLPGRSFSIKSLWIGLAAAAAIALYSFNISLFDDRFTLIAWLLIVPAICSFFVMNFTGTSTYTSLSGVKREMRIAVPLQLICAAVGLGLWLAGRFV